MTPLWLLALLAPLAVIAAILAVPPLRRAVVSNHALAVFRRVMPPIAGFDVSPVIVLILLQAVIYALPRW